MKSKIIAIALFVSLSLLILPSCGQNDDPPHSQSTNAMVSQTIGIFSSQSAISSRIRMERSCSYFDTINFRAPTEEREDLEPYFFRYSCEAIPKVVDIWAEIYENGKLIDRVETLNTNSKGKTGILYLFARSKENPQWTVGLVVDEDGKASEGHSSASKEGLVKAPLQEAKAVKPAGELVLQSDSATILMALLYGGEEESLEVSLQELQRDISLISQAEIGVLLKCSIS